MRREDSIELLEEVCRLGVAVCCLDSASTSHFENIYPSANPDIREQRVRSLADPFEGLDIAGIDAKVFHFGPLMRGDIPAALLQAAQEKRAGVVLDGQGLVRILRDGRVEQEAWPWGGQSLQWVDVLKADIVETCLLAGEKTVGQGLQKLAGWGPSEILATNGSQGSQVYWRGRMFDIPAFNPAREVDATGCGDTYTAGYVARRFQSSDVEECAYYAAALASIKLEAYGPVQERGRSLDKQIKAHLSSLKAGRVELAADAEPLPGRYRSG